MADIVILYLREILSTPREYVYIAVAFIELVLLGSSSHHYLHFSGGETRSEKIQ